MTQIVERARGETAETDVVDPKVISHSVQEPPPPGQMPYSGQGMLLLMQHISDEIEPWGRNIKLRDMQLREFIPVEPLFTSALGTVCSRNASFSWKLDGPEEDTAHYQEVLQNAEFGAGWAELMLKVSNDLYTQDSGAFIEIIREKDSPSAKVIGICHLDAGRCYATGNPEEPVWYVDRLGAYHRMKWYQVVNLLEVPATYETMPGLQYCAMTRLLINAQIMRDTEIYTKEKIGGRNPRAITLIQGVKSGEVEVAVRNSQIMNDSMGRLRYSNPILVSSADPNATVDFKTLEIASLPDGFDADLNQKQYITLLALAFMTDYQEFAPLPGGGLGTSSQSEILDKKSRGKGPGLFMKLVSQALNFRVLPKDIQFEWDEQDIQEDKVVAEVKEIRANYRKVMLESQQITQDVAWMMMLDDGDLTQEQYDLLLKQQEEQRLAEEQAAADAQAMAAEMQAGAAVPGQEQVPGGPGAQQQPFQEAASPASQFSKGDVAQVEEKWSEATQIRDPHGRFAGTTGGGGGGGRAGGAAASDSIPPSQGYAIDENGDPIPSDEAKYLASGLKRRADANEAEITADVVNVVQANGGEMGGLEYRVKTESSLARKIESDTVFEGITREKAAAKIGDSVRFTAIHSEENYVSNTNATLRQMEAQGFRITKVKNYWTMGDGSYRGLNTNAVHLKTGVTMELQFHTPTSFHVKETVNHPLFEKARKLTTPKAEKDRLDAVQKANFAAVPRPANIASIATRK